MNSIEQLKWRYAVKMFDSTKKLSSDQIKLVKECLCLTPSSFGLQRWKFLIIENKELRTVIRQKAWNQSQAEEASHLIVFCRPKTLSSDDVEKLIRFTHSERGISIEDLQSYKNMILGFTENFSEQKAQDWMDRQIYIALGQLMSVCAIEGIDTCPMEGFDPSAVDEVLGLDAKGLQSVVLCALGFRGADKYAELKKLRYPMDELIETLS